MDMTQKSLAASIVLGLAVFQFIAIGIARGNLGNASSVMRRRAALWHRAEGFVVLAIVLFVAYYCIKIAPNSVKTLRVDAHMLLGVSVIGLIFSKVAIMRVFRQRYGLMPMLGVLLLMAIVTLWFTSAGWHYFLYDLSLSGGY